MRVRIRVTITVTIAAVCGAVALAGVGNDRVLAGATILVRDGLIAAVGSNLPLPADAVRVDLTGQFVYPGLIDTLSEQGYQPDPHAETDPEKPA